MSVRPPAPDVRRAAFAVLASLAALCLLAGVALALYLVWIVYLLVQDPAQIQIVAHLMELASAKLLAASGHVEGRTFELTMGEPIYWIALLLAAAILLGIIAGVAKALIRVGAELLLTAIKASDEKMVSGTIK